MDAGSKKLTLEERLSQAARKGKRRSKKQLSSPQGVSPTPILLNEVQDAEIDDSSTNCQTVGSLEIAEQSKDAASRQTTPEPEARTNVEPHEDTSKLSSMIRSEPWSSWLPADAEALEPLELLTVLEPYVEELIKQSTKASKPDHSASSLVKVIKEKEELIGQLRHEGEKLSKNELKQSGTIKSLNKVIKDLKEEIEILQKELVEKLEALDEFSLSKKDLSKKVRTLQDQVKELQGDQLQLESLRNELSQKEDEFTKFRASMEVREKTSGDKEAKLTKELESLRTTSREEITMLESNLEQLRIKLEVSQKVSGKNDHDDHLQEQCKLLRSELESNRSNWTALEDALNSKISALETRLEQAEKAKERLSEELSSSLKTNKVLQETIKEVSEKRVADQKATEELQSQNKSLSMSLQDLKDDFKLLEKQYNVQKSHLEHKIESVEDLSRRPSTIEREDQTINSVKFDDDWLLPSMISSIGDSELPLELRDKLSNDGFDCAHGSPKLVKEELGLDINDIPNEASELPPLPRTGISRQHSSSNNIHRLGSEVPISNQMSAQMVSKLAAEIRRFEVEVSSLKGQCDRAQKEKTTANNEIVRLLEENERLSGLEKERTTLSKEVEDLRSKLETSLQLLGEKTERAEELENDVEDLKDMMKQQIQDMIELQTKKI